MDDERGTESADVPTATTWARQKFPSIAHEHPWS
jgi:hypothetical protein